MSKIFLLGITQDNYQNIDEMTKDIYQYFDGLIFVDHQSIDGTKDLLESRKGDGEIISLPFRNDHSWSMNACLLSDKLLDGDFFILRDSAERLDIDFCKNIKQFISQLEKQNINSVYQYSKLLIAKYYSDGVFFSSPHWGYSARQPGIEIDKQPGFEDPKTYAYSVRNETRPRHNFIDHFIRYYYTYKKSNHLLLGRENNILDFQAHEQVRQKFRNYCIRDLNIPPNVDGLKKYIIENKNLSYEFKWFVNFERILNDFYCYHALNHSLDEILERHKKNELFKI